MLKIALCLCLAIVAFVNGQNDDDSKMFKHPLTDMAPPSDDVQTSHYFPGHSDNKFPIGETVTALCYFSNEGGTFYNVSAIMGSLNSPMDFRHHFQNYSYKPVGMVVKAGEELSLQYNFQLHPDLEPVDYQLAITVFYESETESFSTTFFNQVTSSCLFYLDSLFTFPPLHSSAMQTVELYSQQSEYDAETIGSVFVSILFAAAVAVVAFIACSPDTKIPLLFTDGNKKQASVIADSGVSYRAVRVCPKLA